MKFNSYALLGLLLSFSSFASECPWKLEPGRLGPLNVGMTIPEAQKALGMSLELTGSSEGTDFYYSPSQCKDSFMVIATNYNTDENSTVQVAMIVAGTVATVDGIHVGDSEAKLSPLPRRYGNHLTRRETDHYDSLINAYTVGAESNGAENVLTYFAPNGSINSIVASAKKFVFRVDIGRPEGKWWVKSRPNKSFKADK